VRQTHEGRLQDVGWLPQLMLSQAIR